MQERWKRCAISNGRASITVRIAAQVAGRIVELAADEGQTRERPSQMSGGERQRVAVARALDNDPVIILADEPTGSLETKASANLRGIFQDLARIENRTIIVVTHDPVFAQAADRRLFILNRHLEPGKAAEHTEAGIRP